MSLQSLLSTHALTLRRPVTTLDGSGGPVRAFADVAGAVNVPCSLQPLSTQERLAFAQRQVFVTHRAYFDRDLGVQRQDVLFEPATGKTYVVEGFRNQAGRFSLFSVDVKEQAP